MHAARDTVIRPGDNPYLAEAAAIRFGEPDPAVVQSLAAAGDRAGLLGYVEQLQRARATHSLSATRTRSPTRTRSMR
jgi:hypothetical protein